MERQAKSARIRPLLKICGLRRPEDVAACLAADVAFVGFNLCSRSKRYITAAEAARMWRDVAPQRGPTLPAAVLVDPTKAELEEALAVFPELEVLQLHGRETPQDLLAVRAATGHRQVWKAVSVASPRDVTAAAAYAAADLLLFDTAAAAPGATVHGGSGKKFDWSWLAEHRVAIPFGLAGGIKAGDLAEAAAQGPAVIDVCSGVETAPGVKDASLIKAMLLALALASGVGHAQEQPSAPAPPAASSDVTPPAIDPVFPEEPAEAEGEGERDSANPLIQPFLRAQQTIVSRQELHRWERHVRGFRREHNFALTTGISSGTWNVKRLGSLSGSYDNSGVFTRFQYSFHLQLYRGFGFMLGSTAGYHYESADRRKPFRPVPAYLFPGVLGGVVLNFNPVLRTMLTFDSYLERHNGIQERDNDGDPTEVFITFTAYDFGAAIDVFYDLGWALRLEAHRRHLEYAQPKESSAADHPVRARLSKDDQWLGLGLVYHLL